MLYSVSGDQTGHPNPHSETFSKLISFDTPRVILSSDNLCNLYIIFIFIILITLRIHIQILLHIITLTMMTDLRRWVWGRVPCGPCRSMTCPCEI